LVLQASTMGKGGEIFVLDMGEPVRIVDLARNLILLSGLRPEHDIKIEFSGIRPGEKLFEELNVEEEGMLATHHQKIRVFAGAMKPWEQIGNQLAGLRRSCAGGDLDGSVAILTEIVPDYVPSADLSRRAAAKVLSKAARAFEAV
jgi:FlaA1/EpsC-like NDP-sugar epimerase